MTIESIIRRRAFRDGFCDGRQEYPARRLATRKARWLYALLDLLAQQAARVELLINLKTARALGLTMPSA